QEFRDSIFPGEYSHVVSSLATARMRDHRAPEIRQVLERASKTLAQQAAKFPNMPEYEAALNGIPAHYNNFARLLATFPDENLRDHNGAVDLAMMAVEMSAKEGTFWNTLGVARYRAGEYGAAIEALNKSMELQKGGNGSDWFFLAMAHARLGKFEEARRWYDKA